MYCSVFNCWEKPTWRGYCPKHWSRLKRTGKAGKKTLLDRFFERITKTDSCWEWNALISINGYGVFNIGQSKVMAHRYMWGHAKSEIPKGILVLHKCDNRKCVNPEHLFLGTHKDNMDDMVKKGRGVGKRPRLTVENVLNIRSEYKNNKKTMEELAVYFNKDFQTIRKIIKRKSWKHI